MTLHHGAKLLIPCHSHQDLLLAYDHNLPLDVYSLDRNGFFTSVAGEFAGKDATVFADNIVRYLDDISNLDDVQQVMTSVAMSKNGEVLIPLASNQWFL